MIKNFLIVGYGSSGKRYANVIKNLKLKKKIFVISNQKHPFKKIKYKDVLLNKIKFEMVVICSKTSRHFEDLKKIDKCLKQTKIIVEKPLFSKFTNFKFLNKNIFVGYNLRFDPMIQYLKKKILKKKIIYINLNCLSYLPNWRKDIDYRKSYSSFAIKGGGVTNDLSHELDLANYLVGIKYIKSSFKGKISKLKIKADDFSHFFGFSKNKVPILINLGFFFEIEKRNIYLKTETQSFVLSFDERKIIEFNNGKKIIKYFKTKKFFFSTKLMVESILKNKITNCCTYEDGLHITNLISKYQTI